MSALWNFLLFVRPSLEGRPLDVEYFKYSILSNRVFNTVFNTFFRNDNIDIGYSILFGAGIDIEYSLL